MWRRCWSADSKVYVDDKCMFIKVQIKLANINKCFSCLHSMQSTLEGSSLSFCLRTVNERKEPYLSG